MRPEGYYWLCKIGPDRLENEKPFVAEWEGGTWSFIGSLYMLEDEELRFENIVVVRQVNDEPPSPEDIQALFDGPAIEA